MKVSIVLLAVGLVASIGFVPLGVAHATETLVEDTTCSTTHLCDTPWGDCVTSSTFTVAADGNYTLDVYLICTNNTDCGKCLACARVLNRQGVEVCGQHTLCQSNNCTNSTTCFLLGGETYTLQVCKRLCPGYADCVGCASCSTAEAKIVY